MIKRLKAVLARARGLTVLGLAVVCVSGVADAGIIRRAGSTGAVAPAIAGTMILTNEPLSVGDAFPTPLSPDYIFNDGDAPGINMDFAGSAKCDHFFETCWGDYLPGETVYLEGGIWGGSNVALLSYTYEIIDSNGTVLFAFDETSAETTTGALFASTDAGNPCIGVPFYDPTDSGNCQAIALTMILPDTIPFFEWLDVRMTGTYTAPTGMIFATDDYTAPTVRELNTSITAYSSILQIRRINSVPEGPASALLLIGVLGLAATGHKRKLSPLD